IQKLETVLNNESILLRIVFLDTDNERLVSRYKETRRSHPLNEGMSLLEAIKKERALLDDLKGRASVIIDTTELSPKELRDRIFTLYSGGREQFFAVNVLSFGFKHSIPFDSNLMFNFRFLSNPFYIPDHHP